MSLFFCSNEHFSERCVASRAFHENTHLCVFARKREHRGSPSVITGSAYGKVDYLGAEGLDLYIAHVMYLSLI